MSTIPLEVVTIPARNPLDRTGKRRPPGPIKTAQHLQRLLVADCDKEDTSPSDRARLALAWERLEERLRVLKNKPAPKPFDTTKREPRKRLGSGRSGVVAEE